MILQIKKYAFLPNIKPKPSANAQLLSEYIPTYTYHIPARSICSISIQTYTHIIHNTYPAQL